MLIRKWIELRRFPAWHQPSLVLVACLIGLCLMGSLTATAGADPTPASKAQAPGKTDAVEAEEKPDPFPLHTAVQKGDATKVQELLVAGADIKQENAGSMTPLMLAAHRGDLDLVKLLLDAKADVKQSTRRGTALYYAAAKGAAPVVAHLIEQGAVVEEMLPNGVTPLVASIQSGNLKTVEALLEAGADPNRATPSTGITPLMVAADRGVPEIVDRLIEAGADAKKSTGRGATTLHYASARGYVPIVQRLLKLEVPVNATLPGGTTPLVLAAQNGRAEVVDVLIEAGANVNQTLQQNGVTALMLASQNGHQEVVARLLKAGAAADTKDKTGRTALDFAKSKNRQEVVNLLSDKNGGTLPEKPGAQDPADASSAEQDAAEDSAEEEPAAAS